MKTYKHPIYGVIPKPKTSKSISTDKKLIPMSEWQKKKVGWYRNEKKWQEHISGRVELKTGEIAVLDDRGNVKEVLPKGGDFYRSKDAKISRR